MADLGQGSTWKGALLCITSALVIERDERVQQVVVRALQSALVYTADYRE